MSYVPPLAEFPILAQKAHEHRLVYLDNAATTQKPECVIDALTTYYSQDNANVHRASHFLSARSTLAYESARQTVAQFIGARSPLEIVWTRSITEAINLVANTWGQSLTAGDEILVSVQEHHANIVPWQMLAQRCGAVVKPIPITRFGVVDLDALATLLSPKTRLVAVTHVSNVLGVENPVEDICRLAKSVGAKVLIDGAQALAHHSVDVSQLGCDFYVFSGHKMYGPTGIGALWAPEALLNDLPPWHGGGEMIKKVSFSGTTYNSLPFKFEAGTPNISGAIALATAAKWLANQSVDAIRQHEQSLAQQALEACHQINAFKRIGTPSQDVSLFSFAMSNCHANDVATLLDQQGIAVRSGHHCAMPLMETLKVPGTLRVSFACYNTQDDVDAFVCALRDAYQQLADLTPIISTGTPKNQSDSYAHHQTVAGAFSTSLPPTLTFEAVKAQLNQRKDWNSRYREIMQLGKQLPSLDDRYKTDEFKVTGCESNTWLITKQQADGIYIHIDSEARIIRGLGALILVALNNKSMSMDTISSIESWFKQLNLDTHLSPSRSNGLAGIIFAISKALPESLDS